MAKEKQEPYEFLSNLVLALMDMDRIFSNSFFTSELDISPKTLSEIRRGSSGNPARGTNYIVNAPEMYLIKYVEDQRL